MTLIATPARRRPNAHAFSVPVVREIAPRGVQLSAAGW